MKNEDFICIVPPNIDSGVLFDLAKKFEEQSGYESFRLVFCDDEFSINGIREENEEEKKLRLKEEQRQRKVKNSQFVEQVLCANPSVEYVNKRIETKDQGFAEKPVDDKNFRYQLAWAMREPSGYFLRDGKLVNWHDLNRPE